MDDEPRPMPEDFNPKLVLSCEIDGFRVGMQLDAKGASSGNLVQASALMLTHEIWEMMELQRLSKLGNQWAAQRLAKIQAEPQERLKSWQT